MLQIEWKVTFRNNLFDILINLIYRLIALSFSSKCSVCKIISFKINKANENTYNFAKKSNPVLKHNLWPDFSLK
jgi:hypothetical protein